MYMSNLTAALQAHVLGFVEDIHHLARELSVRDIRQKSRRGTSSGCYLDQQVVQEKFSLDEQQSSQELCDEENTTSFVA